MSNYDRVTKYAHITYKKRVKIIQMVMIEGLTIKKTAKLLKIKPSTTRMIFKKYKEEGKIFKRKIEEEPVQEQLQKEVQEKQEEQEPCIKVEETQEKQGPLVKEEEERIFQMPVQIPHIPYMPPPFWHYPPYYYPLHPLDPANYQL